MLKYQKWIIASVVSWATFFAILFGGVVKNTRVVREYGCDVEKFEVKPRFECSTRCPIFPEQVDAGYRDDNLWDADCRELEKDMLDLYDPKLCLEAKWGFEDPLCPPESSVCYAGDKWKRKCYLSCPLGYDVSLRLNVEHIGPVEKERDLGTNRERYESYRDFYHVGDSLTCQVIKIGNGDDKNHDVLWLDERISGKTMAWWKWSMFTASILATLFTTLVAVASFVKYRNRRAEGYNPVIGVDESI